MNHETEDKLLTRVLLGASVVPAVVLADKTMNLAYGVMGFIGIAAGGYMISGAVSAILRAEVFGMGERIADRTTFLMMIILVLVLGVFIADSPMQ